MASTQENPTRGINLEAIPSYSLLAWIQLAQDADSSADKPIWWPCLVFENKKYLYQYLKCDSELKSAIYLELHSRDTSGRGKVAFLLGKHRPRNVQTILIPADNENVLLKDFFDNVDEMDEAYGHDAEWAEAYEEATKRLLVSQKDLFGGKRCESFLLHTNQATCVEAMVSDQAHAENKGKKAFEAKGKWITDLIRPRLSVSRIRAPQPRHHEPIETNATSTVGPTKAVKSVKMARSPFTKSNRKATRKKSISEVKPGRNESPSEHKNHADTFTLAPDAIPYELRTFKWKRIDARWIRQELDSNGNVIAPTEMNSLSGDSASTNRAVSKLINTARGREPKPDTITEKTSVEKRTSPCNNDDVLIPRNVTIASNRVMRRNSEKILMGKEKTPRKNDVPSNSITLPSSSDQVVANKRVLLDELKSRHQARANLASITQDANILAHNEDCSKTDHNRQREHFGMVNHSSLHDDAKNARITNGDDYGKIAKSRSSGRSLNHEKKNQMMNLPEKASQRIVSVEMNPLSDDLVSPNQIVGKFLDKAHGQVSKPDMIEKNTMEKQTSLHNNEDDSKSTISSRSSKRVIADEKAILEKLKSRHQTSAKVNSKKETKRGFFSFFLTRDSKGKETKSNDSPIMEKKDSSSQSNTEDSDTVNSLSLNDDAFMNDTIDKTFSEEPVEMREEDFEIINYGDNIKWLRKHDKNEQTFCHEHVEILDDDCELVLDM